MSAHHPKAALSAGVAQRKRAAHCRTALPFSTRRWKTLTLRELEAAAGLGLTVILTLDGAAVAGQEAGRLDRAATGRVDTGQSLRDPVRTGARLAREAAALAGRDPGISRHACRQTDGRG